LPSIKFLLDPTGCDQPFGRKSYANLRTEDGADGGEVFFVDLRTNMSLDPISYKRFYIDRPEIYQMKWNSLKLCDCLAWKTQNLYARVRAKMN